MKLHFQPKPLSHRHCRGITLIECLVYIGALAAVFGMGLKVFYHCTENSAALRRNADDITQTIAAGELWRADIRAATQPPSFDPTTQLHRITQGNLTVSYRFHEHQIQRCTTLDSGWKTILPRVEQSHLAPDQRNHVTAWRWELELKSRRQTVLLRPLFSFTAVPRQP